MPNSYEEQDGIFREALATFDEKNRKYKDLWKTMSSSDNIVIIRHKIDRVERTEDEEDAIDAINYLVFWIRNHRERGRDDTREPTP